MTDQPQNEPQAQGQPGATPLGPGQPLTPGSGQSVTSGAGQPVAPGAGQPVAPGPGQPPSPPPPGPSGPSGASGGSAVEGLTAKFDERPELAAGAAFAGGFVLALILKRLAS